MPASARDVAKDVECLIWLVVPGEILLRQSQADELVRGIGSTRERVARQIAGDGSLVRAVKIGFWKREAYEVLVVQRHALAMVEACHAAAKSCGYSAADDAVNDSLQDVHVRLCGGGLATFDERREFAPWIRQVAANAFLDNVRKSLTRGKHVKYVNPQDHPAYREFGSDVEPRDAAPLDEDRLRRGLDRVSQKDRDIFSLHYYGGLRPAEIAAGLGLPVATVYSKLRRTLLGLREWLGLPPRHRS